MIERGAGWKGQHHADCDGTAHQQHGNRHGGRRARHRTEADQREQQQHRLAFCRLRRRQGMCHPGPEGRQRADFRRHPPKFQPAGPAPPGLWPAAHDAQTPQASQHGDAAQPGCQYGEWHRTTEHRQHRHQVDREQAEIERHIACQLRQLLATHLGPETVIGLIKAQHLTPPQIAHHLHWRLQHRGHRSSLSIRPQGEERRQPRRFESGDGLPLGSGGVVPYLFTYDTARGP